MKRRTFLKTSALAAGASMLQACGRERVAYLTQPLERQPGRPGVSRWVNSVCGQCAAGCGTRIRVVDGDARKIEGIPDHPVNHGGLCALGQAGLQDHYNPDRIRTPLRRVGERGSGEFEEISWDDALAEAGEAIASAASAAPELLHMVSGGRSSYVDALLARLSSGLGSPAPAVLENPGAEVERAALHAILGGQATGALPGYDLAGSDYLLSIGPAFLDRGHQPVHGTWAMAQVRAGRAGRRGKLVQAEARMSQTGAFADEWLPLRPGSEGVFARAIAGVIRDAGMVRAGADNATGPDPDTIYAQLFPGTAPTVEEAAATCDVPASKIQRVAMELARAERPLVLGGGSAATASNGLFNTTASLAVNLLLGGFAEGGGVSASMPGAATLLPEDRRPRSIGELEAAQLPIAATWLMVEADPLHTRPAGRGWSEALNGATKVISLGSFLDDATRQADLILPLHSDIEGFGATEPVGLSAATASLARPAVRPLYDSRHPGDIILALATALEQGDSLPWSDFQTAAQAAFEGGSFGQTWSEALDAGHARASGVSFAEQRSPSAEQRSPSAEQRSPVERSEPSAVNNLTLLLFESAKYGDGRGANKPWLQELPDTLTTFMWSSWAEISVADAAQLHITTGDLVEIVSPGGTITVPAAIRPEARPGTVAIPAGGGYTDYGRYARSRGANPMTLLGTETVTGTSEVALSGTDVALRRIGPGEVAVYGRGLRDAEHIPTGWAPMKHDGGDHE